MKNRSQKTKLNLFWPQALKFIQKRVFLKHGSRYDAHFKSYTNRGRVHSFQLYEKGWEEGGGVSYPEFQILQLRRYLRYICTFLMVWGTFHLPLINQYKTQTSCSSKKRGKYLQNISFFFCNVCNLRLKASVAAFLIVFPTAALEAPFSIYL